MTFSAPSTPSSALRMKLFGTYKDRGLRSLHEPVSQLTVIASARLQRLKVESAE